MFKLYKKIIFLFLVSFFFVSLGHSQSSNIGEAIDRASGRVITKESYKYFFESVLTGDNFKNPALGSFDPAKKPVDLKNAIKQHREKIKQTHRRALKGLREVLRDFKISDKKTLERILLDFYKEAPLKKRESVQSDWWSDDLSRKKSAENFFFDFIRFIEDRYEIPNANSNSRKVINLFHEILESEIIGKKQIRLFRKVLSKLGLPEYTHHDEFLRIYLLELKQQQIQAEKEEGFYIKAKDKDVLNLVEKTKVFFDDRHFENLQRTTKFINIIKGFSAQYILFQAAIGAMIYRENITDPLVYEAHTKPGYMKEFMAQSLTPSSVVSFFIFIVVSQKTNYLLYKTGRHFDKKFLKTLAPHMGLASGFFISSLATELYQDADFRQCASSFLSKKTGKNDGSVEDNKHISSCEKSYTKWIQSKWSDYAVDITTLLGASWISHKIIQTVLMGIRATTIGESWLFSVSKRLGSRSGWVGFFITIYVFMESHHFLDKYIGKPLKNYLKINSIQSDLFALNHMQGNVLKNSQPEEALTVKTIKQIKILGRKLNDWVLLKGQDYQWSFSLWLQKTNKVTLFYQQSREMLSNLYNQSVGSYDFYISVISQDELLQDQGFLIDRDIFHENREHYSRVICSDSFIQETEGIEIQTWKKFCEDPKDANLSNEDLVRLAYETTFIISEWLNASSSDFDFLPYLSKKPEDLFSTDEAYSLSALSLAEKMNLVQSVLKSLYSYKDSVVVKVLLENNYEAICLEKYSVAEDVEDCKVDSYYRLRDKMLAFAIHILKEQFSDPSALVAIPKGGPGISSNFMKEGTLRTFLGFKNFEKIEALLGFLKVYKKGEIFFDFKVGNYEVFKKEVGRLSNEDEIEKIENYPYLFFKNMICGVKADSWEGHFVTPHLFENLSYLCEEIYSDVKNSRLFHSILFSKPIQVGSQKYSNLWSLLEDHVRTNFKSEEALLEFFEQKSEKQIEQLSSKHLKELDNLNKNYLFPNMINSKVSHLESCEEIMGHYNERNLRSIKLKNLEISLFQIIYWLNRLEKQYTVLSSKCEIIELLKGYHDSYTKDSNSHIETLEKPEVILSSVLQESPFFSEENLYFTPVILGMLQANIKAPKNYNEIEYAILFELKFSLDGFFQQLHLLRMKEDMEKKLAL